MRGTHARIFFLFVALAVAAMTFAGTASAGWTWDDGAALTSPDGWTWDDGVTQAGS